MTTVRQAKLQDIDEMVIAFESYRHFYRREADPESSKKFLSDRIQNKESIIYIAVSPENKILGFTQLYPSFSSTRLKRVWILNDLFVHKEARGLGVSKLLINEAKALTRQTNACALLLETEKNNIVANKLYLSTDFQFETNNFFYWEPKNT